MLASVGLVTFAAERPEGGAAILLSCDTDEEDDVGVEAGVATAGRPGDANPMTLATTMTITATSAAPE